MAALNLPEEIAEHLRAAIQLSNKRVHLRLLDEAETLTANLPGAAAVVAGVVLESILQDMPDAFPAADEQDIAKRRELRNCGADPTARVVPSASTS
jgi:hypothetical protein